MGWKNIELEGTKNGVNTTFIVPFNMKENTEQVFFQGQGLERVTSAPVAGQYRIQGTIVTVGAAPLSTQRLQIRGWEL